VRPLFVKEPLLTRSLRSVVLAAPLLMLVAFMLYAFGSVLVSRSTVGATNQLEGEGALPSPVAPDVSLTLFDGSRVALSELRGRAVVVNFWGSWCVPCREEAPVFTRLAREYERDGVTFLGIAVWDTDSDARAFLKQFSIAYPTGMDGNGRVAIEFGVKGVPETFFVRPDGTMSRRWIGPINERQLRGFVDEIRPTEAAIHLRTG
jgi:cytochrome c biogenesis protein CcmG, thiol:disulfide interchange protein DsbE